MSQQDQCFLHEKEPQSLTSILPLEPQRVFQLILPLFQELPKQKARLPTQAWCAKQLLQALLMFDLPLQSPLSRAGPRDTVLIVFAREEAMMPLPVHHQQKTIFLFFFFLIMLQVF